MENLSKKLLITTLLFALCLISISSVNATDVYINSTNNTIANATENGTNSGDRIYLDEGTYNHTHLNGTEGININKNLTLIGKGADKTIIDANKTGRIFNITNGGILTLINLTLTNGNIISNNGGAIFNNNGKLSIKNCVLTNNKANKGGAIYNENNNLSVTNCSFTNNTALNGGAIQTEYSNLTIENSTFNRNNVTNSTIGRGGAIKFDNGDVIYIYNTNFTENDCLYWGGAIYAEASNMDIEIIDCEFIENFGLGGSGLYILNSDNGTILIDKTVFEEQSSRNNPHYGAIYVTNASTKILNSSFKNNNIGKEPSGGALRADYSNLTIIDSNFTGNHGDAVINLQYGVLFIDNVKVDSNVGKHAVKSYEATKVTIKNSVFNNNSGAIQISFGDNILINNCSFDTNKASTGGGSIHLQNIDNATISDCNFTNSYSGIYGGAININEYEYIAIKNCKFESNNASFGGGAIFTSSGENFNLTECNFSSNKADSGGVLYLSASNNVDIFDCNFYGNNANYGGSIYIYMTNNTNITNSKFSNNKANVHGGVVFVNADPASQNITIKYCAFDNNIAGTYGGAILNQAYYLSIMSSNFTNNTANTQGGAIFNNMNNFTIIDSNMINNKLTNTTNSSGGAIYNRGANFSARGCTFTSNIAIYGGAIWTNTTSNITSCAFTDNTANNSGGAIYNIGGTNTDVINSNFTNNAADYGGGIFNGANMFVSGNLMSGNYASILGNVIFNNGTMGVLNLTYLNNSTHNVTIGQDITLFATLVDDMGNPITGQNITFYVNGIPTYNATVNEGYANFTYAPSVAGVVPVNGTYDGNGDYPINIANGQLQINKKSTNSTIITLNGKVGQQTTISGVATDENGDPLVNSNLIVTINGQTYNVTTDSNGDWSLNITPNTAGNLDVIVSWVGNDIHEGFINNTIWNVAKLNSNSTITVSNGKVGQQTTISGVVTDEFGNPIANTSITVNVDGITYSVTTDNNGKWILTYIPIHTGNITVTVNWEGNDTYFGFSNNTIFAVNEEPDNNQTNKTNETNKTIDISTAQAVMKKTGTPIISILLVLLSSLGLLIRRKK